MHLRLTVVNPMAGRAVEVRVAARRGATFAELLDALDAAHALTDTSRTWSVDSVGVPPTATLGLPPLLDGARLMIRPAGSTSPDTSTASAASGLLQLHAVGGPDSGLVHDLPPGRHVLGRGANTPIRVGDSSLSRLHAEITVAGRSITVRDLESTNGTWVNGIPVGVNPSPSRPGQPCRRAILGGSCALRQRFPRQHALTMKDTCWSAGAHACRSPGRPHRSPSPRNRTHLRDSDFRSPPPPSRSSSPRCWQW